MLSNYAETTDGNVTRYTDPDTGAWVELVPDEDASNPIEDFGDGSAAIAYREGDHYVGTADPIPDYMTLECPRCGGCRDEPQIMDLYRRDAHGWTLVGRGSPAAMEAECDRANSKRPDGTLYVIEETPCVRCEGASEIETDDIAEYVKATRGATGTYVFDAGTHGEATAVVYVTNSWDHPDDAAESWGKEYQSWAEGDVWGIRSGYRDQEAAHEVWGYIGSDHAESEALRELQYRIAESKEQA